MGKRVLLPSRRIAFNHAARRSITAGFNPEACSQTSRVENVPESIETINQCSLVVARWRRTDVRGHSHKSALGGSTATRLLFYTAVHGLRRKQRGWNDFLYGPNTSRRLGAVGPTPPRRMWVAPPVLVSNIVDGDLQPPIAGRVKWSGMVLTLVAGPNLTGFRRTETYLADLFC